MSSGSEDDTTKNPADKGESSKTTLALSKEDTETIIDGIMKRLAEKSTPITDDSSSSGNLLFPTLHVQHSRHVSNLTCPTLQPHKAPPAHIITESVTPSQA